MKLLLTLDFPPEIGGIQRYLFDIVRFTFSKDDLVLVGCSRVHRASLREVRAGIRSVSTPFSVFNKKFSCIPLLLHFLKLVRSAPQGLEVSCGNVYAAIVPWIASFFIPVGYAVYTYGTEIVFLRKKSVRAWLLKKVVKRASHLHAISHYTASLLKEAGIEKEATIVPPRVVVPVSGVRSGAGDRTSEGRIPQILCVGRLVPRKGFCTAIEALVLLPREMEWQCVMVGDGPLGPALEELCIQRNVDGRVSLKKDLSDEELSAEYDRSSVFILPGSKDANGELGVEGFGIVLIEAMAHGVPVIAGRTGAAPEVLEDGACGILVEAGDAARLAREIQRLLGDPLLRERLAVAGLNRVKRCYAW
jgi:phosphatidylinositol alpha-1,6-mannosyltransferase